MTDASPNSPMLVDAAAVFGVRDILAARDFYRDRLGFTVSFEWGEPTYYVCLLRDEAQLHLRAVVAPRAPGNGHLCVFARDVDALYGEFVGRGVGVVKPPETFPYGMREFDVDDIDGNRVVFGTGVETKT